MDNLYNKYLPVVYQETEYSKELKKFELPHYKLLHDICVQQIEKELKEQYKKQCS